MRVLNSTELSSVSGGESDGDDIGGSGGGMCPGGYGIDTGNSCVVITVNDVMSGQTLTMGTPVSSPDSISMSMSVGGATVTTTGSIDGDGHAVITVTDPNGNVIGGACVVAP